MQDGLFGIMPHASAFAEHPVDNRRDVLFEDGLFGIMPHASAFAEQLVDNRRDVLQLNQRMA